MNFSGDYFFEKIYCLNDQEFVNFCFSHDFLKRHQLCNACGVSLCLYKYKRSIDGYSWRCMNKICLEYKKYTTIRKGSFFERFNVDLKFILKVIIKRLMKENLQSILRYFENKRRGTIIKILNEYHNLIPNTDFSNDKLGGPGFIVQVDETMLNYKVKSHRGRSPTNRTDALCIVEVRGGITRAFACIIPDKRSETLIPIIVRNVTPGSIIWTDEHRSYCGLTSMFEHSSVCHKYEFINQSTGCNTQAVESFNNSIKYEIKRQKGVLTLKREDFIRVFLFFFNNSNNLLEAGLNLIKRI